LIPYWMVAIYFIKETLLGIGAAVIFKRQNIVVKSNIFGKLATVIVFCAVFVIALFGEMMSHQLINIICACVLAYILFAFIIYVLENYKLNFKVQNTKNER